MEKTWNKAISCVQTQYNHQRDIEEGYVYYVCLHYSCYITTADIARQETEKMAIFLPAITGLLLFGFFYIINR